VSSDLREVEAAARSGNLRAQLAIDVFVYRLCAFIGSFLPALRRLDALVFTAGIGEHSPLIREAVCRRLTFLGLDWDRSLDGAPGDRVITKPDATPAALVVHTEESWEIARDCLRVAAPH
jgi:acetate kinase